MGLTDDDEPTKLIIKVYHGGGFNDNPCRSYMRGKYNFIDCADVDDFGMDALEKMIKQIGYFCLASDSDFLSLFKHVHGGAKLIEIYVEHWASHLLMTSCHEEVITQSSPVLLLKSKMQKCMMLPLLICLNVITMILKK
ncbi:hypothetical protein Hanom_Chr05g00427411 [Helianthus anomalus]